MSARQQLSILLDQWFKLTQAEGRAIQLASWEKVKKLQAEKAALQPLLAEARKNFDRENAMVHGAGVDFPFRAIVGRLLSLQTRNAELMDIQVKRVHAQRTASEETQRNLRRLEKSYAARTSSPAWNSYS